MYSALHCTGSAKRFHPEFSTRRRRVSLAGNTSNLAGEDSEQLFQGRPRDAEVLGRPTSNEMKRFLSP